MASVKFYDRNDHCIAVIRVELPGIAGQATVAGLGDSRADALARAASVAHRIMEDPVMRALMPPQAKAAIVAARGLAAAAKRGLPVLKGFWRRLKGPGKKRLARALVEEVARRRVADVADVGWNPLKRKRPVRRARPAFARRVAPPPAMRRPPPPEPAPEPAEVYDEQPQHDEQPGGDQ